MTELEKRIERIEQRLGIPRPDVVFDAGNPYLADFANVHVEDGEEPLKDWVVPLAHSTLTREQVAERCIKAAEKRGYRTTKTPSRSKYSDGKTHFHCDCGSGFAFYNHGECLLDDQHTTLEEFEEYCGVTRQKTRLEWLKELPDGYRERAVANCSEWVYNKPSDVCLSMWAAISGMCDWRETPEKYDFWCAVCEHYTQGTPLPPLPVEVYDVGFWWDGDIATLDLPDKSSMWLDVVWRKDMIFGNNARPHALTHAKQHIMGRFYLIKDGTDRNDWQNYGLYTGDNKFVHGCLFDGVVCMTASKGATLLEVTKYEEA